MGQAFDRDGNVLGEAEGETKRAVFEELNKNHPDAEAMLISTLREKMRAGHGLEALPPEQIPTIGRIVHYRLSADDASQINRRRTNGKSIADRMKLELDRLNHERDENVHAFAWPAGAQAHIGNGAIEGDTFPMLITKVWGDTPSSAVNGQVFLDGNDVLWVTSACVGEGPRTFSWPTRS